eukprot:XP_020397300.1 vegetative cell wall protein gp1-like [Zea mays]
MDLGVDVSYTRVHSIQRRRLPHPAQPMLATRTPPVRPPARRPPSPARLLIGRHHPAPAATPSRSPTAPASPARHHLPAPSRPPTPAVRRPRPPPTAAARLPVSGRPRSPPPGNPLSIRETDSRSGIIIDTEVSTEIHGADLGAEIGGADL